jgi:hypothetical protein
MYIEYHFHTHALQIPPKMLLPSKVFHFKCNIQLAELQVPSASSEYVKPDRFPLSGDRRNESVKVKVEAGFLQAPRIFHDELRAFAYGTSSCSK